MKETDSRIAWNAKIRQRVQDLLDRIGMVSGIPLEAVHIPSEERLSNALASAYDTSSLPRESTEIRIGSTRALLVSGFLAEDGSREILQTTLDLAHTILKEYLQHQTEIESFSQELLENYQALNIFYRISEALGSIQDVRRVASIILGQAVRITHAERGSVLLLDKDEKALKIAASHGFSAREMDELQSLSLNLSDTLCSRILETGKPLIVQDIKDYPDLAVYSKGIYKTGSFLSIPLQAGDDQGKTKLLGVLNLSDKATSESFKSNDIKALNALTAQASVALANAQTLKALSLSREQLGETLDELMETYTNLEKRALIIDQVNKISLAINATLDLSELFDKIGHYAKTLTAAEEATVYYRRDPGRGLRSPDAPDPARDEGPESSWENLFSFSEVLDKGEALSAHQPAEASHLYLKDGRTVVIRDLLVVPFFDKGEAIGAIAVLNKISENGFSQEDREMLETLGNQAAIAVENARLIEGHKKMFLDTIMALAAAVDAKDPYTNDHSRNVSIYSKAIAEQLLLPAGEIETLERTAILHDIGKIAIPESILNKPGKLTAEEFDMIKTHPVRGVKIVENIEQMMTDIVPGMKHHHERYDGKGYPDGLKGEEIPFPAQILAAADTYDALTSDRPYRKGPGHEFAVEEIKRCSGTQFSPRVVEAFLASSICRYQVRETVMK